MKIDKRKTEITNSTPLKDKLYYKWFCSVFICLILTPSLFAIPPGSSRPWNSVNPNSIGEVNAFNGALNMGIPLLNIGGRGDTQIPLVLRVTKRWKTNYYTWADTTGGSPNNPGSPYHIGCFPLSVDTIEYGYNCPDPVTRTGPTPVSVKMNIYPNTNNYEFDVAYGPGMLVGRTQSAKNRVCYLPTSGGNQDGGIEYSTRFYLNFISSDGSEHELVDQNTMGKFREDTNAMCNETSADALFSRGNKFVSTDGSATVFISDTEITTDPWTASDYGTENPVGMTGILYSANGSQYRINNGQISYITDRNGNTTTFTYSSADYASKMTSVTDSIGRTTTIEYDIQDVAPYGLSDKITTKGLNGENQVFHISKAALNDNLRSGYVPQSINEMWHPRCDISSGCPSNSNIYNPSVTSSLWLPDGRSYKFQYNSFAEVTRVESPTGGAVEYDYTYGGQSLTPLPGFPLSRKVIEQRVYENSSTQSSLISKTKYNRITNNGNTSVTLDQTDANNNLLSRTVSYYYGYPRDYYEPTPQTSPYGILSWKEGQVYKTNYFGTDGTTLLRSVLNKSTNKVVPWLSNQDVAPSYDTRPTKQISIAFEDGQALAVLKKTEYDDTGSSDPDYFSHLNVKRSKAYNYKALDLNTAQNGTIETIAGLFSETDLASVSETNYLYDAGYKERHILGLPTETRVLNPSNQTDVLAKSQFSYDEQGQYYSMADYGSTIGYEAPTGTYASLRGNTTTLRTWNKDENSWIEVHRQFDNFGNLRKAWDSSGDQTRFVETEYSSQYYYAYPTKKTTPAPDPTGTHGTSVGSNVSTAYDFWTGLPLSVTDANGQTTSVEYDNLLRPKRVIPPAGGAISEREYGDAPGSLFVKKRTQVDAQHWAESTVFLDNLGRTYKTQTTDLQGDVFTETQYDSFGRIKQVSSPYRQGEQKIWSKLRYDNAGRVVETFSPAPDGQIGTSNGVVQFGISTVPGFIGTFTVGTDTSGRNARSLKNVFGQVVRVDEPTGNNDLGTLDSPNQPSFYSYNVKGELIKTQQGQQNRYFMYDSLGRLTRVRQPEQMPNANLATTGNPENNQWTAGFTYDIFGNVRTVTDAKNTVITNDYDKAGRVKMMSYSDGTPQIDYYYDGTGLGLSQLPQFAKGNLTKISNGISETRYTSFDNYGRVLANQQITDGQTYNFGYKYDDYGNLAEETYPSGRVVKTLLDADGALAAVISKRANTSYKNYASNFDYAATGAVRAMMLGNGRWETAQFDSRFQIKQVGLGNSPTDTSLWKVNYDYGELNADGSVDANKNIGSIAKQTITLPMATFVQTYKYDELNRLKESKETTGSVTGAENWKQTFDYDRYGNRTEFYQKIGNDVMPINNQTLPTVDPATNRFATGQGYVYDFNGNLVQDAENRGFTYNGDDKQTVVRNLNIQTSPSNSDANVIGRYYYDGEGKRIKKVTNTEITVFVYDGGGALAAEYSTAPQPTNPMTSYLTTDHLGSPRVITDKQGNVISRRDFMPFGEEITAGIGGRDTINQKYSIPGRDNVRQRFTGYEKDEETDLDFAQARMYQNKHGRFTAPDPYLGSASLANPQTFNRYSYTGNNPVNLTDPSGLDWCSNSVGGTRFTGAGVDCSGKYDTRVNGSVTVTQGGNFNGIYLATGTVAILNDNGSVRIISAPNGINETVTVQGSGVQAESDPLATTTGDVQMSVFSRPLDGLPPCPNCGSADNIYTTPIDTSQNEPLKVVNAIRQITELCSMVPGVGTPCAVIATITAAGQGDISGAAQNGIGLIPFGKLFSKLKRFNVAEKIIEDAEKAAPCLLCFVAGTEVQTIDGLKPIEEIKVGDKVLSYNEQTQQNEYQIVYNTFRRFADDIYAIKIENEQKDLEVTSEHPFYIKIHQARDNLFSADDEGDWVRVRDLEVGDEIRLASGGWAKILDINFKGKGEVFNFSVANNNNYYVGNSRLLTHNTGCGNGGVYRLLDDAENVVRTGRTKDLAAREAAHLRDATLGQFKFETVFRTNNYAEQRGLEHFLYKLYPNAQYNKIRAISPTNPNKSKYIKAAEDFLKGFD